jgi:N-acetylneuraminate synthase
MRKPVYIIAEAGVNHNGSLELAKKLVHVAAKAGADAIKFQTFNTASLVSIHAEKANYQKETTLSDESQLEMIRKLELSESDHIELIKESQAAGIRFLSTPFDNISLDLLTRKFGLTELKISSGDLTNLPLLYSAASTGAKMIVSTGISTLGDIEDALGAMAFAYLDSIEQPSLNAFRQAYYSDRGQTVLRSNVTLLHCTTEYPTPYEDVHLKKMITLKQAFGLQVGYSDHTMGSEVAIAAVAMGAEVIEKHITLDRTMNGPDHKASMEPDELRNMVRQIRNVELSIGISVKIPANSELANAVAARKSVVAASSIGPGDSFTEHNITLKRPGNGHPPSVYWELLGKKSNKRYEQDDLIE